MLQRIQTVFLLGVVILMTVSLFMPMWVYQPADSEMYYLLTPFYLESLDSTTNTPTQIWSPYVVVAALALLSALVAFFEITKFKDRMLQMKLGALNSLLMAGTLVGGVWFATDLTREYEGGGYAIGLFLPAIAMICNILANRFIRKDEKLVRSVDRIR